MDTSKINFSESEGLLDNLLNFFNTLCQEGIVNMIPLAEYLICAFCIIDLAMSWWLYEGELRFPALIQKILKMGAFLYMINNWSDITALIQTSFEFIGYMAAGNSATEAAAFVSDPMSGGTMFSPSKIWDKFGKITNAYAAQINGFSLDQIGQLFGMLLAYIVTLLGFLFMTLQLFLTTTEFAVFTCLAIALLPFGCLSYTSFLSQRAISGTFSYGIKLMVLYFLLGCVSLLTDKFIEATEATSGDNFAEPLSIGLAYLVIGYLIMKAPDLVQSMMSGTPNLGNGVTPGGMASAAYAPFKQRGGGGGGGAEGGGGTYSYAGAAVRAAAMATGGAASFGMGRVSQVTRAAGMANAKGGPLAAKIAHGIGYYIKNEGQQAIGATGKGLKSGYNATLGRVVASANRNIAKPAMNTYKSAMNRQDQEIKTGGKAASATAHAAGAAYRWSKGKIGF